MKKYDYCLWDFNGTILDDVQLGINSVNTLLRERGIAEISSREVYRDAFDFPIIDYYKKLGFDFSLESFDFVAERWVEEYNAHLSEAQIHPDVVFALDFFEGCGMRQSVISASEMGMLSSQLKGLGVYDRFEQVLGIDNIYGDSKLSVAKRWKKEHPNASAMFIGDTTHDCETARLLGADCYIVCAGHHAPQRFCGTDAKVFNSLAELVEYLKKS